jgi:hypothetical protein
MSLSRNSPMRTVVDVLALAPPGQGIPVDGKELRYFLFGNQADSLLHPLLQLAGLPALDWRDVHTWDRMNPIGGQGLLAWHRRKLGWLFPTEVRCLRDETTELSLAPTWRSGGAKALIVSTGPTSAVVLENRQPQGVDAAACGRGILAYRVDTQAATSPVAVLNRDAAAGPCRGNLAAYDLVAGQKIRVADTATFELLAIEDDGSYRLRVSRRP